MQTNKFYEFSGFRLDAKNRLLWRDGKAVALTPKEFELLFLLVSRSGEVVSKDEFLETVWADAFVEEGTLTRNVSWLRKKLEAASGNGAKFIETVPKRGYRFLPAVTEIEPAAPAELVVEEQTRTLIRVEETATISNAELGISELENRAPAARQLNPKPKNRIPMLVWLAAFCCLVALGAFLFYFRKTDTKPVTASRVVPFSGALGRENTPSFSPDGKQLAYAWNGGEGDNFDIYVRLVSGGEPVRLTESEFNEHHPAFSPDGTQIAFVRSFADHGEVVLIPALGGTERRVCRLFSGFASISFSPDGKTLAVIDTEDSGDRKQYGVYLVDLPTGARRRLNAPADYVGETTPRFSRDGKHLAFVRLFGDQNQDIFVAPTNGGEPRRLTFDQKIIHSLAWSAEGEAIFFVSLRGSDQTNVWRVAASGGEPELVPTNAKNVTNIAVSPAGKTVAFIENRENMDIWRAADQSAGKKFIATTYNEHSPSFSPDGKRVAFVTNRTGKNEIWLADAEGKNLRQITDSDLILDVPRFSPDGSQIAFNARAEGSNDLFVVSAEGGAPRRLTTDAAEETAPFWSGDGNWIYFLSNRTGEKQIWKIAASGAGEAVQITSRGASQFVYASAGDAIFFTRANDDAVRRIAAADGANEQIISEFSAAGFSKSWSPTPKGMYFLAKDAGENFKIKLYDFAAERVRQAADDNILPQSIRGDIAVADEKTILYVFQDQNSSSIMLAEIGK